MCIILVIDTSLFTKPLTTFVTESSILLYMYSLRVLDGRGNF